MAETPIAQVTTNVEAARANAATQTTPTRGAGPFQLAAWWYAMVAVAVLGLWLFPLLSGSLADAAGLPSDAEVYGDSHGIEALGMLVVFASVALPALALALTASVLAFRHGRNPWQAAKTLKAWLLAVGVASLVVALLWTPELLASGRQFTADAVASASLLADSLLVSALSVVPWLRSQRSGAVPS